MGGMKIKLMIIVVTVLTGLFTSCVSVDSIKTNPTLESDQAIVKIDSVTRDSRYSGGGKVVWVLDEKKNDLVVVDASFLNNGTETVTVVPVASELNSIPEKEYGSRAIGVFFYHFGEAFVKEISGVTPTGVIELPADEADRRTFVFVYPKDKTPDVFSLKIRNQEKKVFTWVTVPLVFEED